MLFVRRERGYLELSALRVQTLPISWRSLDLAGHTRIPCLLAFNAEPVYDVGALPFIGGTSFASSYTRRLLAGSTGIRSFRLGQSTPMPIRRRSGGLFGGLM